MVTAHLLTKNNQKTISKCLESISFVDKIIVGDLNSTDDTTDICREYNAEVFSLSIPRDKFRNILAKEGSHDWNFFIEPWEFMIKGHKSVENLQGDSHYCSIIQEKLLFKEIRFWKGKNHVFQNPVFEKLKHNTDSEIDVMFYSTGRNEIENYIDVIKQWKADKPTSAQPLYYEACVYLSLGQWDKFINASEHYMALDSSMSMSSVMNRYYYAMANVIFKKKVKPALQNLTLCLSEKPLMAEFWCLMADVFYHLVKDFKKAKCFYEDAISLGSNRLKSDKWPMDISKYKVYPEMMIKSCNAIIGSSSFYY